MDNHAHDINQRTINSLILETMFRVA